MGEDVPTTEEDLARGFRRELKDAVDEALERDGVPVGDTRVIDYIEVKRVRANPLHDYRVFLK
ncbi:MAG TPA: hypothetical protein VFB87_02260 [Gaiellaceae bacterium]|jgi:hypothetical protein|nr:hypothetical protein [Gaiellaceae bacterium]